MVNTEAIHKAGRSRPEKKTSPNSWASNLSIMYCFCLIWLKSAHSIFPVHDCEEGEHRKLKIQRSKPLPPGKSKNIGMQGQIILQLVPPNSSPALQELACSSRRSAPAFLLSTIWPSSPAVQPSPGESETAAAPIWPLPPRARSKVLQNLGTPPLHPDSEVKGHLGSSNPKKKGRDNQCPMKCPFSNKMWLRVGNELSPKALHPSSVPSMSPTPASSDRHNEEGSKIRGPASRLGRHAQEADFASESKGA